jgi:hypothetical protein
MTYILHEPSTGRENEMYADARRFTAYAFCRVSLLEISAIFHDERNLFFRHFVLLTLWQP